MNNFKWSKLSNAQKITALTLTGFAFGTIQEQIPEFKMNFQQAKAEIQSHLPSSLKQTLLNPAYQDLLLLCKHEAWKCENDRGWKKVYKSQVQSSLLSYSWAVTLLTAAGEVTSYVHLLGLAPFPLLLLFAQFRLDELRFHDESVRWKQFEKEIMDVLEKGDLSESSLKNLEQKKVG